MRRRIREILTIMALGTVLTAAMAGLAWAQPVSQQYSRLSVVAVEGENAWIAKSGREEEKAAAGVPLSQGQILRTGESTGMYLNADGDKIIRLDSTTRAVITEATDKKLRITLEEGFLFFDVQTKLAEGDELYFDTAHTSMRVRGTSGYMLTSQDAQHGGTAVQLLTGAVEYTSGGQTGKLVAGDGPTVILAAQPGQKEPYAFEFAEDEIRPKTQEDLMRELFPWLFVTHAPEGFSENLEAVAREEEGELTLGEAPEPDARNAGEPNMSWKDFSERQAELKAKSASQYGKPVVESSEESDDYATPAGGTDQLVTPDGGFVPAS